jgi:hypothetical protein
MLTNLVQHNILILCKDKHSLFNLFNTRPNGSVVEAQIWNIVDIAIHLVFGPKPNGNSSGVGKGAGAQWSDNV